jgi:crotonobetainyl-CoA:carnitine CoA-transferase CaiB-like acyl-CoA transferase
MTSISNFGQTGPYRDYKASDIVEFGMGGPMYQTGIPEREPLKLGGTVTTTIGGNIAATFTMGALFASRLQGIGQYVDVSLFEAQAGQAERRPGSMMAYRYSGHVSVRELGAATLGIPYAAYPCKDGYVRLMTMPGWWPRVAQMIGKPKIVSDPRFAELQTRLQHRDEFDAEYMLPWLMEHTKREVTEAAQAAKEACAPINTPEDLVDDPHLGEREFFVDIDHPMAGVLKYPGAPFKMMETPWQVKRPAPLLGQQNEEIYGRLGYSRDDLARLRQMRVI